MCYSGPQKVSMLSLFSRSIHVCFPVLMLSGSQCSLVIELCKRGLLRPKDRTRKHRDHHSVVLFRVVDSPSPVSPFIWPAKVFSPSCMSPRLAHGSIISCQHIIFHSDPIVNILSCVSFELPRSFESAAVEKETVRKFYDQTLLARCVSIELTHGFLFICWPHMRGCGCNRDGSEWKILC